MNSQIIKQFEGWFGLPENVYIEGMNTLFKN